MNSIGIPRQYLTPSDLGVILLPTMDRDGPVIDRIRALDLPHFEITNRSRLPWEDPDIRDRLNPPQWRQCLILADTISAYETGLVLLSMEAGCQVFVAMPEAVTGTSQARRLQQASAFILSWESAHEELSWFH